MPAVYQAAAGINYILAAREHQAIVDQGIRPAPRYQAKLRHRDLELVDEGIVQFDDIDGFLGILDACHLVGALRTQVI